MLQKLKQQKSDGFTIIEVLIVLAIAGLILLIVFLAVPNLQRNSRNTQRKNDVQSILGAVSEYESNNAGALPGAYDSTTGALTGTGSASANVKLGYYTGITFADGKSAAVGPLTSDTVEIVTGAKCDTANAGKTVPGSARQVTALYEIETSSGLTATCQDS